MSYNIQSPIDNHVSRTHPVMANVRQPAEHMLTLVATIVLLRPSEPSYTRDYAERWINGDRTSAVIDHLSQRTFSPAEWQHCVNMQAMMNTAPTNTGKHAALTDGNDADYTILPIE